MDCNTGTRAQVHATAPNDSLHNPFHSILVRGNYLWFWTWAPGDCVPWVFDDVAVSSTPLLKARNEVTLALLNKLKASNMGQYLKNVKEIWYIKTSLLKMPWIISNKKRTRLVKGKNNSAIKRLPSSPGQRFSRSIYIQNFAVNTYS